MAGALELYLVRHGIAAPAADDTEADRRSDRQSSAASRDEARPLTPEGIAALEKEAAGLDALEVRFDVIITSPLVRARQTAEVLAKRMKHQAPVLVSEALAPSGSPAEVIEAVAKQAAAGKGAVALVGHEPGIGLLACRLLHAREPLLFKKGGICRMDFDVLPPRGVGALRWFAPPKMLRLLGR
jgi:phosphohistidine phosphatase